jgi:hypothetical protein
MFCRLLYLGMVTIAGRQIVVRSWTPLGAQTLRRPGHLSGCGGEDVLG